MEEDANSWIRRTRFSHTVSHRLDSKLASVSFTMNRDGASGSKSLFQSSFSDQKPLPRNRDIERYPVASKIQRHPLTNKQRSVSPSPQTVLPDSFKEAKSDHKRFSTPNPRRSESKGKRSQKQSLERKLSNSVSASKVSPLTHLGTMRIQERVKSRKETTAWSKYFDNGGRRVNAVETDDEYGVDMSKLFLGLRFAHGLYSRLYHGKFDDKPVAVKLIRVPDDDQNGCLAARLEHQFKIEVTLLSRLNHPNVIKFVGARKDPPVYCIITEYLAEGSLRTYTHKLDHSPVPMQKLVAFALDIARGMEYIHSCRVIHRDLKPENVLIDEAFHLKIADFGIACEEEDCDLLADDPGTYRWMAPEMIKRKPYGRKADVYSFGLVLWEMITGAIPYEDMNPIQAAFAVVHKKSRPVIPECCPAAMRVLIEQCWAVQPDKRPEFSQIVKVLEQFESWIRRDGNLNLMPKNIFQDQKRGIRHWIQKLGPSSQHSTSTMPKPKFM